jgi:hypothetical protein
VSASADVEAALGGILKRYDRIGFGRRGVLDAEQEILRFAAALSADAHLRFRRLVVSWLEAAQAERVASALHYNLPDHVQTLALRLCASVPIAESLPVLRRLQAGGELGAPGDGRRAALEESLRVLLRRAAPRQQA